MITGIIHLLRILSFQFGVGNRIQTFLSTILFYMFKKLTCMFIVYFFDKDINAIMESYLHVFIDGKIYTFVGI